jgi:hypothetical protein
LIGQVGQVGRTEPGVERAGSTDLPYSPHQPYLPSQ